MRGGFKTLGSAPYSPWDDDNRSNIPNWMDIPGFIFPKDGKAATSNERLMLEFVVAVDNFDLLIGDTGPAQALCQVERKLFVKE